MQALPQSIVHGDVSIVLQAALWAPIILPRVNLSVWCSGQLTQNAVIILCPPSLSPSLKSDYVYSDGWHGPEGEII